LEVEPKRKVVLSYLLHHLKMFHEFWRSCLGIMNLARWKNWLNSKLSEPLFLTELRGNAMNLSDHSGDRIDHLTALLPPFPNGNPMSPLSTQSRWAPILSSPQNRLTTPPSSSRSPPHRPSPSVSPDRPGHRLHRQGSHASGWASRRIRQPT
jgi:hypothetical protein